MNALLRFAALVAVTALAAAAPAGAAPLPVDSLSVESLRHARLAAPDLTSLSWLRRETDYAAKEFGRYLGNNPPLISIATVVTLPEERRPSVAQLRVAGYEHVLAEATDRVGVPAPVTPDAAAAWISPGSERIARWYLQTFIRQNATGSPPPGSTQLVPDWFESAVAGLATLPVEQNRRLAWMHERIEQRIPLDRFFAMARPEAAPAGAKPAAAKARAARGTPPAPTQRLFDAQALSFARFLGAAESDRFIGKVLERTLAGEPQSSSFNIARHLLPRPDALEKEWVAWVKAGAGKPTPAP